MFFDDKDVSTRLQESYYHWRWAHAHTGQRRREYFDRLLATDPTVSRCGRYWSEWADEAVPRWLKKCVAAPERPGWEWGSLREPLEAGFGEVLVPAFVRVLLDRTSPVRIRLRAAAALRQLGKVARSVTRELILAMDDLDLLVSAASQMALESALGSGFALETRLLEALQDEDHRIRRAAASQLGSVAEPRPEVIKGLIVALGDKDHSVMEAAAHSLGQFKAGAQEALAALERTLKYRVHGYSGQSEVARAIQRIRREAKAAG